MAEGTSVPINSFPYYVRVVSGFTSSAVDSVKLNETYSITYSYFANGEALEATDSSIGIADSPEGFVFPAKYSRKSEKRAMLLLVGLRMQISQSRLQRLLRVARATKLCMRHSSTESR